MGNEVASGRADRGVLVLAVAAVMAVVAWVALPSGAGGPAGALGEVAGSNHLVLVPMENKAYSQIVGNSNAPYINGTLIPSGKLFTNYYAPQHPSLPNYLILTSGDTGGCVSDTCAPDSFSNENLFHELDASSLSGSAPAWKVYAEAMPSNCYSVKNTGAYTPRHNPAVYYTNLDSTAGDGSCATNDLRFSRLSADIASGQLPPFAMVVPNLYDDMHTDRQASPCALGNAAQDEICQGDAWLSAQLPAILDDGGRKDVTVLIVWDEGVGSAGGGGQVPLIELGPGVPTGGVTDASPLSHYGLVNAIAGWFSLPQLHPPTPSL